MYQVVVTVLFEDSLAVHQVFNCYISISDKLKTDVRKQRPFPFINLPLMSHLVIGVLGRRISFDDPFTDCFKYNRIPPLFNYKVILPSIHFNHLFHCPILFYI